MSGRLRAEDGRKVEAELLADAMANPLRCKILSRAAELAFLAPRNSDCPEREGLTVRGLSEHLGEPPRKVRYHLDALCEQGLLEVSQGRKRRGALERYFWPGRLPFLNEKEVAALPPAQQKKIILGCLAVLFADAKAALQTGSAVRRPDWAVVRIVGEVDEQARQELAQLHAEFLRRTQETLVRAGRRMETTEERPATIVSANLFFEAPSRPPAAATD